MIDRKIDSHDAKWRGVTYLDLAEAAAERGAKRTSDRLYSKAKYWLDRYRKLSTLKQPED